MPLEVISRAFERRRVLVCRGLLLGFALATLSLMGKGQPSWGLAEPPTPLVYLLIWPCLWHLLLESALPCERIALRPRIKIALGGLAGLGIACLACWVLIPTGASAVYPERVGDSRHLLWPEAPAVFALGGLLTLLAPSRLLASEARNPLLGVVSGALLPLLPLVAFWPLLKASMTHVGTPSGWGRVVLLGAGFGVGWALTAGQVLARVEFTPAKGRRPSGRREFAALALTWVASLVGSFMVGSLAGFGLYLFPFLLLVLPTYFAQCLAPRATKTGHEVLRALILSLPLLVAILPLAGDAISIWRYLTGKFNASFLQVSTPLAVTNTLLGIGLTAVVAFRLTAPTRSESPPPPRPNRSHALRPHGADALRVSITFDIALVDRDAKPRLGGEPLDALDLFR